jgi:CDP-6-deoxy-D-xylo-4-hexulose-3-dehydrase
MNSNNNNKDTLRNEILKSASMYFDQEFGAKPFVPGITHIPVSGKVLDKDDLINLISSSLEMWLTAGDYTDNFEKKISKYLNIRHCLFVNSGSSANLLAISSLKILYDVKDGAEVITSAVNFPTTLNPILQNNLKPIFVDVDPHTYNIDADQIEEKISKKTKGIVLAHTLGNPIELEKIKNLCEKYNLFLMEDMCDALGGKYQDKFIGSFGDVATLSFYPAHHITTGEGGAVLTNNPKLKKIMLSMRDWGRDCYCKPGEDDTCKKRFDWQLGGLPLGYDHKYIYSHIGYNLKASDMQAAVGLSQMDKLNDFVIKRKQNFNFLYKSFSDIEVFDLPKWSELSDPSWFGFPLTINKKATFNRRSLLKHYSEFNIGTRLLFAGNILLQPAYSNLNLDDPMNYPNATRVANDAFWLGVYPGLSEEMLTYVVESTKIFISENS